MIPDFYPDNTLFDNLIALCADTCTRAETAYDEGRTEDGNTLTAQAERLIGMAENEKEIG